ncbi:hypothetical protein FKM82_001801 [Ascaphus truei]
MPATIPFQSLVFMAALHCHAFTASKVRVRDNGYENIVLAINPQVPENLEIITNIKNMVTEASLFLFHATKRRFYYREVKILIPTTWQPSNYQRPRQEAYEKASVIVTNPNIHYGNDPYTLQYEGCGKKGKYIRFSTDFLTDDNLLSVYGSRGRVFVHEWAHLRWGVFDEYNYEIPFFVSIKNKIKATRCSAELSGMYVCKRRSCSDGDCVIDPQTGNLQEGCMFLVNNTTQKAKASIMYMQGLSSVVEFCSENDHDREAPNMQNKMCSYRSSWEVIRSSADFRSTLPMGGAASPPPPSFSLLQSRGRAICLVLDASQSMAEGERIRRLKQAAAIFLRHVVEAGSYVGIVTYNETAEVKTPLRQIVNDAVRINLTSYLPDAANGGTSICTGILSGLQVLKSLEGSADGSEMVLVSSGRDGNLRGCFSHVSVSGSVIHTIAIGPNADPELEHLAELTGGLTFFASDNMESDSLIGAFSGIFPANGHIAQPFIKVQSVSELIGAEDQLTGSVNMDSAVGNDTLFLVTWQAPELPRFIIHDPAENNYTAEHFDYDSFSQVAYLRVPGTSQGGTWTYKITNTFNSSQVLSMMVTTRPASEIIPPVTVIADMNKDTVTFPSPMIVFAEVKQGLSAILGVNVTAVIETDFGNPVTLTLADDGAGADVAKDDGVYSRYIFSFTHNGRHTIKVHVEGKNTARKMSLQNNQAMYIPGYIENGTIKMNPPRPLVSGEIQSAVESFSRTVFAGSFIVTNVPYQTTADVFPPCKIVDLEAKMVNGEVLLSWTAPGDNYDQGIASSYEIRMSTSPLQLRENFSSATVINTSTLRPQNAGRRDSFSFLPRNIAMENGPIAYIGVRTVDKASLLSDISNLVHVATPVQSNDINYVYSTTKEHNVSTVIFIAVSVISVCLVLGASIYGYRNCTLSRLHSHISASESQTQVNTIQETQRFSECQVQISPLQVFPERDVSGEITNGLEEETEV